MISGILKIYPHDTKNEYFTLKRNLLNTMTTDKRSAGWLKAMNRSPITTKIKRTNNNKISNPQK